MLADLPLSWKEYEGAVLEHLRQEFAGVAVRVLGTDAGQQHTVIGRFSLSPRQLDVAAYGVGDERPFFIADAKKHGRKLNIKDVECFVGMADDIGVDFAALLAPAGFSAAAERRANAASIHLELLTIEEAMTCRWLPLAQRLYPNDWIFRRELAKALKLLDEGAPPADLVDCLDQVAFDEWEALVDHAIVHHSGSARRFLIAVATEHPDEGWRFNAVQRLLDNGFLDDAIRSQIASAETDPDVIELLQNSS